MIFKNFTLIMKQYSRCPLKKSVISSSNRCINEMKECMDVLLTQLLSRKLNWVRGYPTISASSVTETFCFHKLAYQRKQQLCTEHFHWQLTITFAKLHTKQRRHHNNRFETFIEKNIWIWSSKKHDSKTSSWQPNKLASNVTIVTQVLIISKPSNK